MPRNAPARPVEASATVAAVRAFGDVRTFNRTRISQRAGLIAALPVVAMLALGLAIGNPTDSVIMGVGAMLVGVAWRAGEGPEVPPVGTMAADATMLAVATLLGTLTGHWDWLHLIVLAAICLVAGVATTLGRRGVLVGTQTIIAFVVFGRFPETVPNAFGLAGLVFAGGVAQVLCAATVALPLAWRRQRAALATAYLRLADLTAQVFGASVPAADALDDATAALQAPALFADPDLDALTDLAATGRRIRLELIVFGATLDRVGGRGEAVDVALERVRGTLTLIASALGGDAGGGDALAVDAERLGEWGAQRPQLTDARLEERIAALTGQVAAAARMAAALTTPRRAALPGGRPTLGSRVPTATLRSDLERMWENATLQSAAGRHAVRLTVTVAGTELLTQLVALPRGYWAVVAAASVLRPGFGATFTRGAERVLGTLAGVVIATLIAVVIDPSGWGLVALIALLAYGTYALFPASFAVGVAMMTGVIVFVLHVASADTAATALDRGIDTVIGGAIGLAVYALWPTWSGASTGRLLANLIDHQRDYLKAVFDTLHSDQDQRQQTVAPLARRARIAWTDAQTAIELARSEPRQGDIAAEQAAAVLAALRRVVYGVHTLRLEAVTVHAEQVLPGVSELGRGLADALDLEARHLRDPEHAAAATLPPLRHLYRDLDWPADQQVTHALRPVLDELVDAVDTAAMNLGLELP